MKLKYDILINELLAISNIIYLYMKESTMWLTISAPWIYKTQFNILRRFKQTYFFFKQQNILFKYKLYCSLYININYNNGGVFLSEISYKLIKI